MSRKLTDKQQAFVREYLLDLNATKAAIRAGYSAKTAYSTGQKQLKKSEVQSALQSARAVVAKRLDIKVDRVLREVARCSLYDVRNLFDADGNPKAISELDDDIAAAISGVDVGTVTNEMGEKTRVMKYRLVSKEQSLDKLMKHLGLYAQDHKTPQDDPVVLLLQEILGRSIEPKRG